ncbi:helix-turn-helix domain-containing protein [bacterium]|nr:helix-turn-helix domain-containing protein [bacterium]
MVSGNQKFALDIRWPLVLKDLGILPQDLLRLAHLPLDLFSRESPTLTTAEYYRFWEGIDEILASSTAALRIGQAISVEWFSPPIFACLCSPNLNVALNRLAHYKPLIGPMRLLVTSDHRQTTVTISGLPEDRPAPPSLLVMELVFLVHLVRLATRSQIKPLSVQMTDMPLEIDPYNQFFGVRLIRGNTNLVTFSAEDARQPFLTANESMWSIFEPELNIRMHRLGVGATVRERVRACLMEILAGGEYTMADVAKRLAISPRTLQRHLAQEGTTFQNELNSLRAELARHYLTNSHYSGAEISFLLGYQDANSFFRAFHAWTGQTPETVRAAVHSH